VGLEVVGTSSAASLLVGGVGGGDVGGDGNTEAANGVGGVVSNDGLRGGLAAAKSGGDDGLVVAALRSSVVVGQVVAAGEAITKKGGTAASFGGSSGKGLGEEAGVGAANVRGGGVGDVATVEGAASSKTRSDLGVSSKATASVVDGVEDALTAALLTRGEFENAVTTAALGGGVVGGILAAASVAEGANVQDLLGRSRSHEGDEQQNDQSTSHRERKNRNSFSLPSNYYRLLVMNETKKMKLKNRNKSE